MAIVFRFENGTVVLGGLDRVELAVREAEAAAGAVIRREILPLVDDIRDTLPVKSGTLKASFGAVPVPGGVVVRATAFYAKMVQMKGQRGIEPKKRRMVWNELVAKRLKKQKKELKTTVNEEGIPEAAPPPRDDGDPDAEALIRKGLEEAMRRKLGG